MFDRGIWHVDPVAGSKLCNLSIKTCAITSKHYETKDDADEAFKNYCRINSVIARSPIDYDSIAVEILENRVSDLDWLIDFGRITITQMGELKNILIYLYPEYPNIWKLKLESFVTRKNGVKPADYSDWSLAEKTIFGTFCSF